ncbi:flagellar motor switch phosphatase FliY [Bacillus sp. FJAT-42376]|uniref:flagellar motor switch phosphatase FliY n=1 Tax=Bacillus sp. FJAT-42376 TaxID=2014076 RepID=UPI000F503EA3|nr:flagellar motor switch phosphatase FliY [Bacillus sp. FJAT-42376]AZB42949.1 flagellar motor switch phosphatase FliY [Bacillus sp. FJAT-42376]
MGSNEMLSQDEIDALLKGTGLEEDSAKEDELSEYLDAMEADALGEIGNISFGSSATALSTLLNQKVEITTPEVSIIEKNRLSDEFPKPYVAIEVNYTEGFLGSNLLVIEQNDAAIIADLMIGGDGTNPDPSLGEIHLSAVQEAMNQMMGSAATSMSTIFNKKVDISPPRLDLLDINTGEGTKSIPDAEMIIKVSFQLKVGVLIDSKIMQVLPLQFAKDLINELMNPADAGSSNEVHTLEEEPAQVLEGNGSGMSQPLHQNSHAYYENSQPVYRQEKVNPSPQPQYEVKPAQFANFEPNHSTGTEHRNLDLLMDIPLQVTVELGRTKRSIKEILELSSGSIIELDKLAGEPVDILINRKIVAKGEVVVIDENFGVRVTDIISQQDRLNKLK